MQMGRPGGSRLCGSIAVRSKSLTRAEFHRANESACIGQRRHASSAKCQHSTTFGTSCQSVELHSHYIQDNCTTALYEVEIGMASDVTTDLG